MIGLEREYHLSLIDNRIDGNIPDFVIQTERKSL